MVPHFLNFFQKYILKIKYVIIYFTHKYIYEIKCLHFWLPHNLSNQVSVISFPMLQFLKQFLQPYIFIVLLIRLQPVFLFSCCSLGKILSLKKLLKTFYQQILLDFLKNSVHLCISVFSLFSHEMFALQNIFHLNFYNHA